MKKFDTEREGQLEFFNDYIKVVDNTLTEEDIINDSNDGVVNGNIIEFKLHINNLNAVLCQTIKYLSALRIKGKPCPANILLVSLNEAKAYLYHSEDYLPQIERVYDKSASLVNEGFICKEYDEILNFKENDLDEARLIELLREKNYTKINIDENCIVGWAEKYYRENPEARKSDFIGDTTGKVKIIGEIREPNKFKDYIRAYAGKDNVRFQYLMDKLNDTIQKKNLGAFYTPEPYVDKSIELLRQAIARVPEGNDYVIIDRCAGTGNLEKRLTDEELSHCIVSTIEYYEYKVLLEILGSKVRHIIPPTEKEDTFNMGLVRGADALSQEYIESPVIKKYLDNPKCSVILFENPPYAETTSAEHQKAEVSKSSSSWKKSFAVEEMRKEIKGPALNDLGNAFIWSAFKYYLRQPTDSYVVYSPVKYWKVQHLIDFKFGGGFAFNRKHFHTNIEACIMCALWYNEKENNEELTIKAYDIINGKELQDCGNIPVKKVHSIYNQIYYDKRTFENDVEDGILVGLDGLERTDNKITAKPLYNENILCYMIAKTSGFDNPDLNSGLLIASRYDAHGFFVRKDNFLEKLPMFCSSRYITYNRLWTERARIMKSADGAEKFSRDVKNGKLNQFLLKCLVFTCFETQNHMRTLVGTDNRFYRNELCLDTTNGETLASITLKDLNANEKEKELFSLWEMILKQAKKTKNYNKELTYGIYQIFAELNTYYKDEETGKTVYDYPDLQGNLLTLKTLIKEYYLTEIVPTLFEYEFLK